MLANRLTLFALGLLIVAAIGYNVWSWRSASAPLPATNASSSAPTDPAAALTASTVTPEAALAPQEPAAPVLSQTSVSWSNEGGTIEARLALALDERHQPITPAVEFDELSPAIFVSLTSTIPDTVTAGVLWRRLANDAIPASDVAESPVAITAAHNSFSEFRPAGNGGFLPGDYELEISIGNINPKRLPFRITSKFAEARHVAASEGLPGMNVALAALGGKIASPGADSPADHWRVSNLIDGFPFQVDGNGCLTCGWSLSPDKTPGAVVFALAGDRPVTIDSVVIDPSTTDTTTNHEWNLIPRNVRISASTVSATDGFSEIAAAQVTPRAIEQLIRVPPTPARFVKVQILSNWGGPATQLGEVKILEQPGLSALDAWPRNIALPALGGVIARYSSQENVENGVQYVIDNALDTPWVSATDYLPQDFVFAFKDDQVAKIDRIVLHPHGKTPDTWPKTVLVSIATNSLFDFEDVGQFDMAKEDRDFTFPVKRDARFLRVRIVANHGGRVTSLNEVRVYEGSAPGYVSVLARTSPLAAPLATTATAVNADSEEKESNNDIATANPLTVSKSIGGTIEPLGESDYFSIDAPSSGRQVLSLKLAGSPFIKTSVALVGKDGREQKRFDPAQANGAAADVSWLIDPGKQTLHVSEPPASIVLIWDTSGSMNGMTDALRDAVLAYLSQVRPTEQLNMIRFSDDVEVLLKDFTSDRDLLRAAAVSDKFYPDGGTRFYDAVQEAIALLSKKTGNRAIIVLSDGEDSLSKMEAPRFWEMLHGEGIRIYTIGLGLALKGFATRVGSTGQRFMGHASYVTGGKTFFARDSSELKALYDRIAGELRAVSRYRITPTVSAALGKLSVAATGERIASVAAPARVQLVLDASGSMNRQIGNKRMIQSAKDVLAAVIKAMPDGVQVGLRVYGHRIKEGQKGACEDSQQVQPIARLDRTRLLARLEAITALGTTPIAYSLEQVGRDLGDASGQQMIILVTDGREECGGDPKAAVAALKAKGLNVRINVVGFALTDKVAQQQLADAAALTGGTYVTASDDSALKDALDRAMRVPFEVLDSSGATVATGQVGDPFVQVPEGTYAVVVRTAERAVTIANVHVIAERESRVELKKEGREIGVKVNQP